MRRNWNESDELFRRKQYYVHYMLVQGLGSYGLGFLHLVGGLSQAATSALRQLLDAGTLVNLPAGFKAKGARIMNDDVPLQPIWGCQQKHRLHQKEPAAEDLRVLENPDRSNKNWNQSGRDSRLYAADGPHDRLCSDACG